ncbi:gamma-glutamylcyclotransferase family protein [Haliangium ochraceum]|uniref:AIG2 family protein n=1 Tax=Haliangium ochraceum (strain DSM 14365 / JCM 11303 / SMP-2) TaxID=502025 RepID=D0LXJ8_HALO1|nr:gamma-glutamylcyclotransferase family protein [Haliangium ochraceum]ACY17753.1 AIG2 family protein [Haliangium ochraceum DSM 14365]
MTAAAIPLFVYGTLRPGHPAHEHLLAAHVIEVQPAIVCGRLLALPAGYPGLAEGDAHALDAAAHAGCARGDLLHLRELAALLPALDEYEGDEYRRVQLPALLPDGSQRQAWCYLLHDWAAARGGTAIGDGDWRRWIASRA